MSLNSISKIIDSISLILGYVRRHCFAVFDMKTFIIINGISFILSAISILFINFKLCEQYINEECSIREIKFIKDIKEGYSYLMERKA